MSLLLFSLALSQLPSPSSFERLYPFKWDGVLASSTDRFFNRLAQLYCESAFNPRAVSDFGGWKRAGLDTLTAIRERKGAAGIAQFIWPTAQRYGAASIDTLFDPLWSIPAMCQYMHDIRNILLTTKNPKARRRLQTDRRFEELASTASYNTGEGRIRDRLNKYGDSWEEIKYAILREPREYAERIWRVAGEMKQEERWNSGSSEVRVF